MRCDRSHAALTAIVLICLLAAFAEAARQGSMTLCALLGTAALAAGALAWPARRVPSPDDEALAGIEHDVADEPEEQERPRLPASLSLAFLSDPFAIPPPVLANMQAVEPFVETLCGQIDGIQHDVEHGVVSVVQQVEAINVLSSSQRERIHASLAGTSAIRDAAAIPQQIVAQLGVMLEQRDRIIAENFAGLEMLAHEFKELRSSVDVISKVADKVFFLSVNAAVEAHHQGAAGQAFSLIAGEMRSLADQTATGAREVGQSISAFAVRMQRLLEGAMPDGTQAENDIGFFIRELETSQGSIISAGHDLDTIIQTLEAGHQDLVTGLSGILGSLQFHDVMRQRLEQVFDALRELEDLVARSTSGAPPTRSLLDVLEKQRQDYVMASQREVHCSILEGDVDAAPALSKIQLF